jgi:very-short-patch-repair endonuclease
MTGTSKNVRGCFRDHMTLADRNLRAKLRMGQPGVTFYRQKPVGECIADLYCPEAKLVIEVDGSRRLYVDR